MNKVWRTAVLMAALAAPAAQAAWTDNFGTHYAPTEWAHTVRDHKYGVTLNSAPVEALSNEKLGTLATLYQSSDAVLIIGGLGSGRDQVLVNDYMNGIVADGGAKWRNAVYERATTFTAMQGSRSTYVQVGNEISSSIMSQMLHNWAKDGKKAAPNDESMIPLYVEYYLAPTAMALNAASADTGRPVNVVLGSAINYANRKAAIWLSALLNYKVVGTYAPELAGKYVYELVDVASIHYLMGTDTTYWRTALDEFKANWIGKGRIKAVWSTEEGGIRSAVSGFGAISALRGFARYTSWWQDNGIGKVDRRCIFWGAQTGPAGTRAEDALQQVLAFTGEADLSEFKGGVTLAGSYDNYLFDVLGKDRRLAVILPVASGSLGSFNVAANGWSGPLYATAHVFTSAGKQSYTLSSVLKNGQYTLTFPSALAVTNRHAIMVEITR